ncbi:MAG: archease [Nanoarchaeota archaeon]|nr:archease [Nanoarchaeota archaeon]
MKYKFLKHTADVKFRAYGNTLNKVFETSVLALSEVLAEKVGEKKKIKISAKGRDLESLLYDFLEQVLILLDSKGFLVARAKVKIDKKNFKLIGEFFGDGVSNCDVNSDVKAITYNDMFVKKIKDAWVCQVVLDV